MQLTSETREMGATCDRKVSKVTEGITCSVYEAPSTSYQMCNAFVPCSVQSSLLPALSYVPRMSLT